MSNIPSCSVHVAVSLQRFFASTDTSGDNMISKDEYMVAMGQQEPAEHGYVTSPAQGSHIGHFVCLISKNESFKRIDTDNSYML